MTKFIAQADSHAEASRNARMVVVKPPVPELHSKCDDSAMPSGGAERPEKDQTVREMCI